MLRRPIAGLTGVTAAALLLFGACGGSGSGATDGVASLAGDNSNDATETTLSAEDAEAVLLDWVECMRGEGVDLPDPTVDDDGNLTLGGPRGPGGPAGGAGAADDGEAGAAPQPDRESREAAREVCGDPPQSAFGGSDREFDRDAIQEAALAFAECMRDEGIADFPDPDLSGFGPGTGPPDDAADDGSDRPRGPFGDVDFSDPDVAAASETCQAQLAEDGLTFGVPGAGGPGAGGPGGGGTAVDTDAGAEGAGT